MSKITKIECNVHKPEDLAPGAAYDAKLEIKWQLDDGQEKSAFVEFQKQHETKFKVAVSKEADTIILSGITDGYLPGKSHHGTQENHNDLFEIRVSAEGEMKCTQWGSSGNDELSGAIYLGNGVSLYFGLTWGEFNNFHRQEGKAPNEPDLFLTQLLPDGANATVQFGSNGHDTIQQVSMDKGGHLVIRGTTTGSFPGCRHNGGPEDNDTFLAMMEGQGNLVVIQYGSDGDDEVEAMVFDPQGNIFLLGRTRGCFPGATRFAKEEDDSDLTLTIVNRQAHRISTIQWGSDGSDRISGLTFDSASGAIIVAGHTSGAFPNNSRQAQNDDDCDLFLSRISPEGTIKSYQWDTTGSRRITGVNLHQEGPIEVRTEDGLVKEIALDDLK